MDAVQNRRQDERRKWSDNETIWLITSDYATQRMKAKTTRSKNWNKFKRLLHINVYVAGDNYRTLPNRKNKWQNKQAKATTYAHMHAHMAVNERTNYITFQNTLDGIVSIPLVELIRHLSQHYLPSQYNLQFIQKSKSLDRNARHDATSLAFIIDKRNKIWKQQYNTM